MQKFGYKDNKDSINLINFLKEIKEKYQSEYELELNFNNNLDKLYVQTK